MRRHLAKLGAVDRQGTVGKHHERVGLIGDGGDRLDAVGRQLEGVELVRRRLPVAEVVKTFESPVRLSPSKLLTSSATRFSFQR